jgi:hypothetical protein
MNTAKAGLRTASIALGGLACVLFLWLAPWPWASLSDPETSQIQHDEIIFNLLPGETASQIFYARRSGLNGLTIWVKGAPQEARLELQIQRADRPAAPFYHAAYKVPIKETALVIGFAPQADPPGQAYRVQVTCPQLECTGLQVFGKTDPDSDPAGWAALLNGASLPADLGFTTTYAYTGRSALQDAWSLLRQAPAIGLALLVVLLPGLAALSLAGLRWSAYLGNLPLTLALSLGLSLAFLPLLLLWSTTAGLAWNGWGIALAVVLAALAAVRQARRMTGWKSLARWRRHWRRHLAGLSLLFLATLLVRLAMVRDLAGPAWVDAFHHGLLARLILEQGALPATLEPFLGLDATAYHAGFHSGLALFTRLSGLDLPASLLLFGQVLNALVVLPVYALAWRLTGSRRAGLAAALAAGLLSPMPAYYTSWGRYTHLAGMLILPAFVLLSRQAALPGHWLPQAQQRMRAGLLAAAVFGGLILVHYRVAAFAALWLALDWLWNFAREGRLTLAARAAGWSSIAWPILIGLGGLLLSLPWLAHGLAQVLLPQVLQPPRLQQAWSASFSGPNLTSALGEIVLYGAAPGFVLALLSRRQLALTSATWIGALFLLANLGALGLPVRPLVDQTAVAISLYLPLSLLAGWALDRLFAGLETLAQCVIHRPARLGGVWAAALVGLGCLGASQLISLLNPGTFLLRQADLPALAWAAENLPAHARLAVNPFNWGYEVYAPADGGGWLAASASLVSVPSPVLSGLLPGPRLNAERALSESILRLGSDPSGLAAVLRQAGIGYVFTGRRGGAISPQALLSSPEFEVLYDLDGVRIFAVRP